MIGWFGLARAAPTEVRRISRSEIRSMALS